MSGYIRSSIKINEERIIMQVNKTYKSKVSWLGCWNQGFQQLLQLIPFLHRKCKTLFFGTGAVRVWGAWKKLGLACTPTRLGDHKNAIIASSFGFKLGV